jgi:hypothetical protein
MDWLNLLALLGGGTGVAFVVRQLFGFTTFVLKRKAVVDVRKTPGATLGEVLAIVHAAIPKAGPRRLQSRPSRGCSPTARGRRRLGRGRRDKQPLCDASRVAVPSSALVSRALDPRGTIDPTPGTIQTTVNDERTGVCGLAAVARSHRDRSRGRA